MKNNFENIKLEELCDYIGRGISPQYVENDGNIVINQKCVRDNRVDLQPARYFDRNQKVSQNKYLKNNDILINSTGTGTLGRTAQIQNVTEKITVDSHVTIVRLKEFVNSKYVAHCLSLNEPYIESLGKGSTNQIELSSKDVGSIIINLPSRNIQDEIADVISSYGSLIENNNKRIELLENMAEEIYKEWFVRMRFPGYEKVKFNKGIPEGWKQSNLIEIINCKNGKEIETSNDGVYEVYGSNGIIGKSNRYNVENALIIGRVGAYCGSINSVFQKSWATDNTIIAKPEDKDMDIFYLIYLLQNCNLRNYAGGSAQPLLTQGIISNIKVLLPERRMIYKFNALIRPLINQKLKLEQKNDILIETRDLLLPRLMSGKLSL